jgi:hypothetical protein
MKIEDEGEIPGFVKPLIVAVMVEENIEVDVILMLLVDGVVQDS